MYRTSDYNEYLAIELQDVEFAKEYLLQLMATVDGEPGLDLWSALKDLMKSMGQSEFAILCDKEQSVIARYLKQESVPKVNTLNELLAPFGLKTSLSVEEVA